MAIRKMALIEKGTAVKRKYTGMTLIEILIVAGIILVLTGLLIPGTTLVRKIANQTKQRAELGTIGLAITTFKNDYGDYLPSTQAEATCEINSNDYSGAQKLAEALCGWDLLGFNPKSCFRSDGTEPNGADLYSQSFTTPVPSSTDLDTLRAQNRRGPYLDMTHISVFKLGELFNSLTGDGRTLADTYVLCDVFGVRNAQVGNKNVRAGTPILYYKANPASKDHRTSAQYTDRIYNVEDNRYLVALEKLTSSGAKGGAHRLAGGTSFENFYDFITDERVTAISWPYRPDSYILISAGPDGEYGTKDDICNF
jgi:type II secretory pathway pseudopilin PulG